MSTPTAGRILLDTGVLGTGGYGQVTRVWDVGTGQHWVRKTPLRRLEALKKARWEREIKIIPSVNHVSGTTGLDRCQAQLLTAQAHVVILLASEFRPEPALYMNYYPLGSLRSQHRRNPFSCGESCRVLMQYLSALKHLHGKTITHRDISQGNILVAARDEQADTIHVALTDFGVSKEGSQLTTECGTPTCLAPEVVGFQPRTRGRPTRSCVSGSKSQPSSRRGTKKESSSRHQSQDNKKIHKCHRYLELGCRYNADSIWLALARRVQIREGVVRSSRRRGKGPHQPPSVGLYNIRSSLILHGGARLQNACALRKICYVTLLSPLPEHYSARVRRLEVSAL